MKKTHKLIAIAAAAAVWLCMAGALFVYVVDDNGLFGSSVLKGDDVPVTDPDILDALSSITKGDGNQSATTVGGNGGGTTTTTKGSGVSDKQQGTTSLPGADDLIQAVADRVLIGDKSNESSHRLNLSGGAKKTSLVAATGTLSDTYSVIRFEGKGATATFTMDLSEPRPANKQLPMLLQVKEIHEPTTQAFGYTVYVNNEPVYFRTYEQIASAPNVYFIAVDLESISCPKTVEVKIVNEANTSFHIAEVVAYTTFYDLMETEDVYTKLGINFYNGTSTENALANIQSWPSDYSMYETGIMLSLKYMNLNDTEAAATLKSYIDAAEQAGTRLQIMSAMYWSNSPYAPDGLGGNFSDLKYSQVLYNSALGLYSATTPNVYSNTQWVTTGSAVLNQAAVSKIKGFFSSFADSLAFMRARGTQTQPIDLVMEWGVCYKGFGTITGYEDYNNMDGADFHPELVEAAKADGVTLDPKDGLSYKEKRWLTDWHAAYNQMLADAYIEAMGNDAVLVSGDSIDLPDTQTIRTITGSFPDTYRDYNLEGNIPDMYDTIRANIERLESAESRMVALSGEKGEQSVYIDTVLVSLNAFLDDPDSIPERISALSDNLNSLASWMASASQVPMLIDYISLSSPASERPRAKATFFENLTSTVRAFFISFTNDYYSIEGVADAGQVTRNVTLWMASGRDQAMVIKTMADGSFTPDTGVGLEVRLVADDVLMRAVASGSGPDVAVFQGQARPVEYGLRGALYDLNQFPDVKEVTSRFSESAMVSQSFGGALYGLPEQQHFMMMFYRTDVLEELGLKAPNTWDELYDMIPVLQENGLDVGFPSPTGVQSGSISTDLNAMFSAFLLQSGGQVYTKGGYSALGSLEAVDAFIRWSELYTKYNAAKTYSPINRFRTGESPVLMTSYTFYNTLVVAAPEIDGLWSMMPLPGTVKEDGSIDRTAASTITSVILFKNAKDVDASWEFLKWWTSTEAQITYAEEIEAIQGESARWPTANLEAMRQISWKRTIAQQISTQWEWVVGIEEVPGSYYVGRTVDNAIKSVINSGTSPRDTILDAVDSINEEIRKKRQEFGLE